MDRPTDNQLYRRGQALGFTLAELFTLLLFLVLLILAGVQQHEKSAERESKENWDRVQTELGATNKRAAALQEKERRLREFFGVADDFGDDFNDLVPAKGNPSDPKREQALIEKAAAADEINRVLKADSSSERKGTAAEGQYDPKSLSARVRSCIDEQERLRGQVANLEKRYGGTGTVFPSCWVTATGGTEFVFDIDLVSTPDGGRVMIHNNQVPGHDGDKTRLFVDTQFNQSLTDADFLDETRQFYDFGREQHPECRFFVRINDRTASQDKSIFKDLLLTVERNFYAAWNSSD